MAELLLELLGLILEPVLDAIFQYLLVGLADLLLRALGEAFEGSEIQNPLLASTGYALLGLIIGGVSLFVLPRHLLHPSKFHGISLIVSPVITGLMMAGTGAILRRRDKKVTQLESFGYGFAFAFGMALVRFFFASDLFGVRQPSPLDHPATAITRSIRHFLQKIILHPCFLLPHYRSLMARRLL